METSFLMNSFVFIIVIFILICFVAYKMDPDLFKQVFGNRKTFFTLLIIAIFVMTIFSVSSNGIEILLTLLPFLFHNVIENASFFLEKDPKVTYELSVGLKLFIFLSEILLIEIYITNYIMDIFLKIESSFLFNEWSSILLFKILLTWILYVGSLIFFKYLNETLKKKNWIIKK